MKTHPRSAAFTLIEVTLALGVASFCLLTVFGLVPIGLTSNQNASEQTAAAGVATAISADLHSNPVAGAQTSRFGLSIPAAGQPANGQAYTQTLFFSQDGALTGPVNSNAVAAGPGLPSVYRATISMTPSSTTATAPYGKLFQTAILITWPALADQKASVPPANFAGSFETATTVDCN
jgi:uncharacterized protein (TIGR02598 family)